MGRSPFRRRQFLVVSFQNRMLLFTFLYFVATVIIFAAVLFFPLMSQLNTESLSQAERGIVAGEFLSLHYRFWPAIPLVFIMIAAHSILISHRVAGPLYRFRRVFKAVMGGDLSAGVRLRKNDYLQSDAELLSEMVNSLRSRVQGLGHLSDRLQGVLTDLSIAAEDSAGGAIRARIRDVEITLGELRSELQTFTLDQEP